MTEPVRTLVGTGPLARLGSWLERLVDVEPHELRAVAWAFLYFFSLLCSYYIIRPMRDEMGIAGGVENLQWLFTATFGVMLCAVPAFGWLTSRYPRPVFLPGVYLFFAACLLVFFFAFHSGLRDAWVARAFFVWVSVFNLFVVSVFWGFMADVFDSAQAKRLFAFIAAGGTVGAITGPALTAALVLPLGATNLLLISTAFLGVAVLCVRRLLHWRAGAAATGGHVAMRRPDAQERPLGGSMLAGFKLVLGSPYLLGICLLMLLFTTLATFLYFQQAHIVAGAFSDRSQRTAVFAGIDLAVNTLTLVLQLFLTGRLVQAVGLAPTLALIPVLLGAGFLALGLWPVLAVLVVVQVCRRAGNYAVMRPAREMLYTVLDRESKYKAKSFIDTAVYRGGDAVSAWAYAWLSALGLGLSAIAFVAVPLAALWAAVAHALGRRREALAAAAVAPETIRG